MNGSIAGTRQRIIEQNRYRPTNPARAHRGYVKGHKGSFQPTVKRRGDLVIDERGHCYDV